MKFLFLLSLLFSMSSPKLLGQALNSNEQTVVWTKTVRFDDASVDLLLTKKPCQIKMTLGGEVVAVGVDFVTIIERGDLLELSATRYSTNQARIESKIVWRHFHWHPEFVAPQDASVDVIPIKGKLGLCALLSGDYGRSPQIYLIDLDKIARVVLDNILLTNKYQFEQNEFQVNGDSVNLEKFENWERFFKGGGGVASASQENNVLTLTVTNAAGSKFTFSNPDGQWHAYSFWGEINRVKK